MAARGEQTSDSHGGFLIYLDLSWTGAFNWLNSLDLYVFDSQHAFTS